MKNKIKEIKLSKGKTKDIEIDDIEIEELEKEINPSSYTKIVNTTEMEHSLKNNNTNINKTKKLTIKKDNNIGNIIAIILSITLVLLAAYNLYYNVCKKTDEINYLFLIINNSILLFLTIIISLSLTLKGKVKQIFKYLTIFSMIGYLTFTILVDNKVISIETQKLVPNLVGMSYGKANEWAKENNIVLNTIYEYSDIYDEYVVINQNIDTNQLLKNLNKITLVISSGPNYDKTIILTNMIGWNIDDAINEMNSNYMNNIQIEYVKDKNIEKDIIIDQSIKGQMRRNDKIVLTVSSGNTEFETLTMIDLTNKTLFEAELWLKRNGINYKKQYDFNETVTRNNIISSSIRKDENVNATDTVNLIVSKGIPITVPNLLSMTVDDVTQWIISNNLKISYQDKYDDNIQLGNIISSNYKDGDIIEEETKVELVTSRGPLIMEHFSSLNEFRTWANTYNVKYKEEYSYNDTVSKGNIIKFSLNEGDVIVSNQSIIIYISNGKAITIPNFIGKSKSEALTLCKSKSLNCSFIYSGYSSSKADTVVNQNKKIGVTVVSGTYVTLSLTKGPASKCEIYIQPTWLKIGSADDTITSLKSKLPNALKQEGCSDITFKFIKKPSNEGNAGMIHPDSAIKGGNNIFTEGKTYTITIIGN